MQELLEWMEYIEDTRQQTKVRHTLKDILVIVLFATLANADDWVEMALFAESYQDYLRKYIELKNGIPSHDTIRRVMGMISPEILQQLYGKWQERLDKNDGELLKKIICIDGKTMCSNKRGKEKASHIVSAWSKEDGFCLGQKAVKEKSNEITAIPELLEKIQIKGQIITIDAMGTQTAIAGKIRQKRADYVLALKKNQYTMYEDVKEYFSNEEFQKEMREKGAYKKTCEKAHGQIEIREYYQTEDIRWLSQKKNWKGLRSIVMEKKRIEKAGKITYEYRYFISSLKTDIFEQKMETATISLAYASRERLRNYDNFKNRVNEIFDDYKETYYIPAGRSMLTLLVNNRSLLENDNLDLITRQFMQVIDNIHRAFEDGIKNVHKRYPDGERKFDVTKTAEMLISDLKGDYRYNAGKEYIVIEEDAHSEKIPINFASSGQQEVLWLLNQLYILMLKKEKAFVIIEEPEAHLYPGLQSKVVEFISYFANVNDSAIFITTHSPYILTSVNTLYCAGKVIKKNPKYSKKVHDIIGSSCEIIPQNVTALKINKDKSYLNLINEEIQELNTEMIDEISDSVNEKDMELYYLLISESDMP